MKLGKLLGVGKSFFGGDPVVAYRLHKRVCLPKFNEGRNPFAPRSATVPAEMPPVAPMVTSVSALAAVAKLPQPRPAVAKSSGLTIAQAVAIAQKARTQKAPPQYAFKPMPKAPMQSQDKPAAKPPVTEPAARQSKAGWATRLNPFRPPEPVAPAPAQQTELSLDSIKVVHNDLADADVEIVPVKSHTQPEAPVLPPARQAWEYLGENLLKAS